MAEETKEEQPAEGAEQEKPLRKSNKSLYLVIGILVLVLAGGGAAYVLLAGKKGGEHEGKKEEKKETKTVLVGLDSFVVNLSEQGRFLKVTMQFEVADVLNQPLVADKTPQIRDAIITLVSSKSVESVSSPEGKFQLKDEILLRANQAVGKDVFKNLYFTEFVMQ